MNHTDVVGEYLQKMDQVAFQVKGLTITGFIVNMSKHMIKIVCNNKHLWLDGYYFYRYPIHVIKIK